MHVNYMARAWDVNLGVQPSERPPFNEAYQAAKKRRKSSDDAETDQTDRHVLAAVSGTSVSL